MPITAPYLPYDRLRSIAHDFLTEHNPSGKIPVPIEEIIEFRFEMDIVPVPGLCSEFDVDSYITSNLREIRVDAFIYEHRKGRYRFSLAHELSHYVLHQSIFEQLKFSTVSEWKAVVCAIPEQTYSWIEYQAYCLAGLILVPSDALRKRFGALVAEAAGAGIDLHTATEDARMLAESHLGRQFEASIEVVRKRLKYDKLWKA
jgi:hypothetical protein